MMKAIFYDKKENKAILKEVPTPNPKSGEVLIKVEASGINWVDLMILSGKETTFSNFPVGLEGSGTVVKNGGGFWGWLKLGCRVAVGILNPQDTGCWAEYVIANPFMCQTLDEKATFEEGALALFNPLTAILILDKLVSMKAKAVIMTGACSTLSIMVAKLCKEKKISVIGIVRREEQVDQIKSLYERILVSSLETFMDELKKVSEEKKIKYAFDCVGGEMSGKILKVLERGGRLFIFGNMSEEETIKLPTLEIVFKDKVVEIFASGLEMKKKGVLGSICVLSRVKKNLKTSLKTKISKEFPLEKFDDAISFYKQHMSEGKVLIKPK